MSEKKIEDLLEITAEENLNEDDKKKIYGTFLILLGEELLRINNESGPSNYSLLSTLGAIIKIKENEITKKIKEKNDIKEYLLLGLKKIYEDLKIDISDINSIESFLNSVKSALLENLNPPLDKDSVEKKLNDYISKVIDFIKNENLINNLRPSSSNINREKVGKMGGPLGGVPTGGSPTSPTGLQPKDMMDAYYTGRISSVISLLYQSVSEYIDGSTLPNDNKKLFKDVLEKILKEIKLDMNDIKDVNIVNSLAVAGLTSVVYLVLKDFYKAGENKTIEYMIKELRKAGKYLINKLGINVDDIVNRANEIYKKHYNEDLANEVKKKINEIYS